MYRKVLIPLDGSTEAEEVFTTIKEEMEPDREVILLLVIRPGRSVTAGEYSFLGSQQEEDERSKARVYLKTVIDRLGGDPDRWRSETIVSSSVAQGIVDVATRERVDLIAMYTHDRHGIAKRFQVQRSVAKGVQSRAPMEVRVFMPRQLVGIA